MQSERIYLVWAHPRHDSLTAHIADAIHQRAMERKIQVTELDWICPYISRHLLSLNPLQARCRRYSRGER